MHFLLFLLVLPSISQAAVPIEPRHGRVTIVEGANIADVPQKLSDEEIISTAASRVGWNVTCNSYESGHECASTIDGSTNTSWEPAANGSSPHWIVVDMQTSQAVGNVSTYSNLVQHTIGLRSVYLTKNLISLSHRP